MFVSLDSLYEVLEALASVLTVLLAKNTHYTLKITSSQHFSQIHQTCIKINSIYAKVIHGNFHNKLHELRKIAIIQRHKVARMLYSPNDILRCAKVPYEHVNVFFFLSI